MMEIFMENFTERTLNLISLAFTGAQPRFIVYINLEKLILTP